MFLHQAQTLPVYPSRQIDGTTGRMIISGIKALQRFRRDTTVILLAKHVARRMRFPVEKVHQRPSRHKLRFRGIDQKLTDVGLQHHLQFLLRKHGFLDHGLQYGQRLGKILAQGIKSQIGVFRRTGQLQPGTVIIQTLRYLAGGETHRPLAQHPVGEQGLQGKFLMPTPALEQQVDAHHIAIARIEHIHGDTIGHTHALGFTNQQLAGLANDRGHGSVQHRKIS